MRKHSTTAVLLAALAAGTGALAPPAGAATAEETLRSRLNSAMGPAGGGSGAYVFNITDGVELYNKRGSTRRILASNTKLFTTAAAFDRHGAAGNLRTRVLGDGALEADGSYAGNLYLRGGGDPTFGSRSFGRNSYGGGASVEGLVSALKRAGIRRVTGRVVGDESLFDSRRGVPDSGYAVSIYVGPLSALAYNRGLTNTRGSAFAGNPAGFSAVRLDSALEGSGVKVSKAPQVGRAPGDAQQLAEVSSPPVSRLARLTNKPSDNFFAEMLVKGLGARDGAQGTTSKGARAARAFAQSVGSAPQLVDGSGLSRGNRASPKSVVALLRGMRARQDFKAYYDSLAIAGRDGTLGGRMGGGPAGGNCHAKTGTISGVSTLSGYCRSRAGDEIAFSFLMNGVSPGAARGLQDRMAQAIAGFGG